MYFCLQFLCNKYTYILGQELVGQFIALYSDFLRSFSPTIKKNCYGEVDIAGISAIRISITFYIL